MLCKFVSVILAIVASISLHNYSRKPFIYLCETEKCPYCFGTDFCSTIAQNYITLRKDSLQNIINNYISVKNVYSTYIANDNVILKKLGSADQFYKLDEHVCIKNNLSGNCNLHKIADKYDYEQEIKAFLLEESKDFKNLKVCSSGIADAIITMYLQTTECKRKNECLKNLWTILHINAEPLLLMLLKGFKVPKYHGACGRLIAVENAGKNLNSIENLGFFERAFVALQILEAVQSFTEDHELFRIYLTDVSPDNIAIDTDLIVAFIDLENAILTDKAVNSSVLHHSENMREYDFAYSEKNICSSYLSDHNYYAVCKLLLSKKSPWPMMENGLLHSPPKSLQARYSLLFDSIENCAENGYRFETVKYITYVLREIIEGNL